MHISATSLIHEMLQCYPASAESRLDPHSLIDCPASLIISNDTITKFEVSYLACIFASTSRGLY